MNTKVSATDVKVFVPTLDFGKSLQFYMALGWKLNWERESLAEIELANVRLYLQNFYEKAWAENFMIYIDIADAESWYQHVKHILEQGEFPTARAEPPKKESYGAFVTYVWDPCGVLLHLAQKINPE